MKTIPTRWQFAATVSPLAIGMAMLVSATAAQAQDAPPPADPPQQTEEEKTEVTPTGEVQEDSSAAGTTSPAGDEGDIVVTGFRASLQSAINKKKTSDQVVESVSAEDIGKLPDASIAESLARLPGLTSQRLNGRSAFISIRGFGPDFSTTLLNGREQTSTGDNRAVEFDQYPSEVVNRVDVYKTMTPNLVGQGLVGTVDIRTTRPLESRRQTLAVGIKGSYADIGKLNSGSDRWGRRANATYVDQFSDDTIGIALSASYVDEPYQIQEYNAWGWGTREGGRLINGNKSFVTSSNLKRYGLTGTFQADLADAFRLTVDGFYSKFDDDFIKRGIELPLGDAFGWTAAGLNPGATIEDGVIVDGTFHDIEAVVNNHHVTREASLKSGGVNLEWKPGNGWKGALDVSFSRTDREELIFESNAGTGSGQGVGARDTLDFECSATGCSFNPTLDYSDPDLILLTSPMGWGQGPTPNGQAGYYNNRIVDDELRLYRADVERELGGFLSSVRAGLALTNRDKSLTPDESFVVLANGATVLRVPDEYLLKPTDLSYLGLGPVISYDPIALLDDGFYELLDNPDATVDKKAYEVGEDLLSGYVMLNINHSLGSSALTGNLGVQAVRTRQKSTGAVVTGGALSRATKGAKYWDILPSLNLSLRTDTDFVFRLGLARQMQRPRLDDMRVSFDYGLNNQLQAITGSGGNPELRPYRANAVDLTAEKYFGIRGYLAAQLFYKQLKNFIYTQEVPYDYVGLPLLGGIVPPGIPGLITQPVNAKGGKIYGFELAGTLPFGEFIPALDGFGVTGGYSYTKSRVRPSPAESYGNIPGYSRHVANGTLFFERWGFSARASARYRSTFIGEFSGFGGDRVRRRAGGETIIDAQVGYDFGAGTMFQGASIFIQGQNLTDEPFGTINPGAPLEVIDYQSYGRRYQAGITYKF